MAGNSKNQSDQLESLLLKIFQKYPTTHFSYKKLSKRLGFQYELTDIKPIVKKLIKNKQVKLIGKRIKYIQRKENLQKVKIKDPIKGVLDASLNGSGYVIVGEDQDDIYIAKGKLGKAFDGDTVEVIVTSRRKNGRLEGYISNVLKRHQEQYIGILSMPEDQDKPFAFFIPDNRSIHIDFFIPKSKLNGAKDGEKVVVNFVEWPDNAKSPIGEIDRVLGKPGTHEVEMASIIIENKIATDFPKSVMLQADNIPDVPTENDLKGRKDFRQTTTFTIDPHDAKDFDDAISVRKIDNNTWEVGVHIADVSHYVKPNTELDKEAFQRGNSVYLVDRVIPMFPEKLSNMVCSLRPNEEKLCFAVVFEMDVNSGSILNKWIGKTIIYSDKRFAYEEAQQVLETKEGPFSEELTVLNKLAYKLREKKFANGAIAFESTEVKFKLDDKGKPLGVYVKERKDSNMLIEDFMLLANKTVTELIATNHPAPPFVYRVHDLPKQEKLVELEQFVKTFGYKINISTPQHIAASLNKLMEDIKGKPEQSLLEQLAIRSMAKAIYTTKNIGHYGLAFPNYTHFTSPIRRYADVLVHRGIEQYLKSKNTGFVVSELEEMCKHISDTERQAMEAERESIKYKQVEFMQDNVGKVFEGIISGTTEWGIFVEVVENKCEGLVRIDSLQGDQFKYMEKEHSVVGWSSDKAYRLGDKVLVKLIKADLNKRTLDFVMMS